MLQAQAQFLIGSQNPLYSVLLVFQEGSKAVLRVNFDHWEVYPLEVDKLVPRQSITNFK